MECIRLCVKDRGFSYKHTVVKDGKGEKDRVTRLPHNVKNPLLRHLQEVKTFHARDLTEGFGSVYLAHGSERKYPHANREWEWQYVFPSARRSIGPVQELNGGIISAHLYYSGRSKKPDGR